MSRGNTIVVYLYGDVRYATYEVTGGDLTATLKGLSWHRHPDFNYESLAEFEVLTAQHGGTVKRLPDTANTT